MRNRINVTNWVDCETITRKCGQLLLEMMSYQKFTWPLEDQGKGAVGGDSPVIIAAIELRDRLEQIITRSREANAVQHDV